MAFSSGINTLLNFLSALPNRIYLSSKAWVVRSTEHVDARKVILLIGNYIPGPMLRTVRGIIQKLTLSKAFCVFREWKVLFYLRGDDNHRNCSM